MNVIKGAMILGRMYKGRHALGSKKGYRTLSRMCVIFTGH